MQDQAAAGEPVSAMQRPGAVPDTGMKYVLWRVGTPGLHP